MVAIAVVGSTAYVISLPGVGDALSRVKQILALHHGVYERPPPPRMLGDAVVSVEDEHFYDNFVVNVADGAGRAALGVLQTNRDPGGSTIDQQLAKQRQLHVLGRLVVNHHLTRVQANAAYRERLPLTTARR